MSPSARSGGWRPRAKSIALLALICSKRAKRPFKASSIAKIGMITFRAAEKDDLDRFYAISLATGHLGADASHLYDDPKMMGHIYSAPYLMLAPDLCFVAVDDLGVAGYIVGAIDTLSFERLLEDQWWPVLRAAYDEPNQDLQANWSADQRRSFMIHHPERTPVELARAHPAHLHMNLLPRIQGQGIGPKLLKLWLDRARELGAAAVHLGADTQNTGAIRFWKKSGFKTLDSSIDLPPNRTTWLGRDI